MRRCEYLFRLTGDQDRLLYVSTAPDGDYDTYRLFLGTAPQLSAVQVNEVEVFRDGGTTIVETAAGTLMVPAPQDDDQSTWSVETTDLVHHTTLVPLNPDDYEISETEHHASIHPK